MPYNPGIYYRGDAPLAAGIGEGVGKLRDFLIGMALTKGEGGASPSFGQRAQGGLKSMGGGPMNFMQGQDQKETELKKLADLSKASKSFYSAMEDNPAFVQAVGSKQEFNLLGAREQIARVQGFQEAMTTQKNLAQLKDYMAQAEASKAQAGARKDVGRMIGDTIPGQAVGGSRMLGTQPTVLPEMPKYNAREIVAQSLQRGLEPMEAVRLGAAVPDQSVVNPVDAMNARAQEMGAQAQLMNAERLQKAADAAINAGIPAKPAIPAEQGTRWVWNGKEWEMRDIKTLSYQEQMFYQLLEKGIGGGGPAKGMGAPAATPTKRWIFGADGLLSPQ